MESRRGKRNDARLAKSTELPHDFLRMVEGVFSQHFEAQLKILAKIAKGTRLHASGRIFPDEVILAVSLGSAGELSAATVYASCDFDPKASSPKAEDLLSSCIDAIGEVFNVLMGDADKSTLEKILHSPLGDLENVPFEWTPIEIERVIVNVKLDRANLELDKMADDWLAKNDPNLAKREEEEERETEKLFVTGKPKPAKDAKKPGGGTVH